jgi:GMP synthase (glutamine-hydrolysing)
MILIIDNQTRWLKEIKAVLQEMKVPHHTLNTQSLNKGVPISPQKLKKYKGIILSGGPARLGQSIKIREVLLDISVLIQAKIPIFGICLGHQLIGYLYGGELKTLKQPLDEEIVSIKILKRNRLFEGIPTTFKAFEAHSDIVNHLPDDFELLASSRFTKYEAIKHKKRPIYSVQFHPEKSGEVGKTIIKNFVRICG